MVDFALGPWSKGLDNISPETAMPPGTLRTAHNVLLNRAGEATVRPGKRRVLTAMAAHSLWTSRETGLSLCVVDGVLQRVVISDGAPVLVEIAPVSGDPMSYCDLNGAVICSDGQGLWRTDGATLVGLPLPRPTITVTSGTGGDFLAGQYLVAAAAVTASGEEGAVSPVVATTVPASGRLTVEVGLPDDERLTHVRLYRSSANGSALHSVGFVPIEDAADSISMAPDAALGRMPVLHTAPMPPGWLVRYFRGRLLTVAGQVLAWSEPMRYGVTDPRTNFIWFGSDIRFVEAVEGQPGGLFVGTGEGVFFLAGDNPMEWRQARRGAGIPVAGSGTTIPANEFGGELGDLDVLLPVWWSDQGLGIGLPDGRVLEPHSGQVRLSPPASGRMAWFNRRIYFGEQDGF